MSKELEFIEDLFNRVYEATKYVEENKDTIDTSETGQSIIEILEQQNESLEIVYSIKQTLIKAQEQEKVLSIIKETKIDVNNFQTSLMIMSNFTYKYYINNSRDYHTCIMVKLLTEEEFDLLKRWLDE